MPIKSENRLIQRAAASSRSPSAFNNPSEKAANFMIWYHLSIILELHVNNCLTYNILILCLAVLYFTVYESF